MTIEKKRSESWVLLALLVPCLGMIDPANSLAQSAPVEGAVNNVTPPRPMATYQDFAQYPPESRPLDTSHLDLLNPWSEGAVSRRIMPKQILLQERSLLASGVTEEELGRYITVPPSLPLYQFDLNKTVLAGIQDELSARLTVTSGAAAGSPAGIHVTKAEVIGDDAFGSPNLGPATFSCETGGAACTFRWKAPAAKKQYWGALALVVTATVDGVAEEAVLRQQFYSSPIVAGKFTGQFQERLENGSLVVDAGVEVQKHMDCFVRANLFSLDKGVPTHHVERHMIVDPSMKTIAFTFFGKIFRDYGYEGAFRMQDLQVQCQNVPFPAEWAFDSQAHAAELRALSKNTAKTTEPSRIYFTYNNYSYTTGTYASASFSDWEWQSPEKTRKLEMYRKAAEELNNPAMEARKRALLQQDQ